MRVVGFSFVSFPFLFLGFLGFDISTHFHEIFDGIAFTEVL